MTRSRLYELLLAYVAEKIATEELDELINYIRQAETDTDLYVVIDEIWSTLDTDKALPLSSERVYANIINDPAYRRISLPAAGRIANHSTLFRLAGFAALLCVAMALFMLLYVPKHHPLKNDDTIIPGGKKAVLTLGNGKTILLDNAFSGQIASEGKVSITQTTDGRIVYQTDDDRVFSGNRENNIMNKISTPKGGEYQIILPDGTKVWLNAASSLTYPVLFTGNKREVSIDGEAYFEVKKHTIPFIVNTKNQRIEVLGTKFNVNAYKD
jgi:transmembrane sensor